MSSKIIVLDDNEDILIVINTILTIYKYECYTFKEWQNLTEKIIEIQPDLMLIDINLPGKDGRELCKQLSIDSNTSHIPIILFSSLANIGDSFLDCNAVDFIKKPFDVKDFLEKIKRHLPQQALI